MCLVIVTSYKKCIVIFKGVENIFAPYTLLVLEGASSSHDIGNELSKHISVLAQQCAILELSAS